MKTFAIACLLTLACTTVAPAQTGLQLGVHGDAAIASMNGADVPAGWHSRTSIAIGGVLVWQPAISPIGFETGLSFVSKGSTFNDNGIQSFFKLGYIEVPVLLRLAPPLPGSAIRPVASLGVVAGARTSCTIGGSDSGVTASVDCSTAGANLKTLDFGVAGGVGVDVPLLPRVVLHPSISYTRGLATIDSNSGGVDMKNSVFHIGVELRLKM